MIREEEWRGESHRDQTIKKVAMWRDKADKQEALRVDHMLRMKVARRLVLVGRG